MNQWAEQVAGGAAIREESQLPRLSRDDVMDLLSAYCWAIDTSNGADFAETFTPTGGMFTPRYVAEGRPALHQFAIDARLAEIGVQHWNANFRYEQTSPTEAFADCYMFAMKIKPDPPQLELSGFYHDELVYFEGDWRFAARHLTRPGFSP